MSVTMNPVAKKLRGDRCEKRWPCNTELCACNAMDEGADEIDRLCGAMNAMQNMLREARAQLATAREALHRLSHYHGSPGLNDVLQTTKQVRQIAADALAAMDGTEQIPNRQNPSENRLINPQKTQRKQGA